MAIFSAAEAGEEGEDGGFPLGAGLVGVFGVGDEKPDLPEGGQYRWTRLSVPTLVLAGERDPLLTAGQMFSFGGRAGDVRTELIEHVGHFAANEDPPS